MILRRERGGGSVELATWDRIEKSRFRDQATACHCLAFDECWISPMNGMRRSRSSPVRRLAPSRLPPGADTRRNRLPQSPW